MFNLISKLKLYEHQLNYYEHQSPGQAALDPEILGQPPRRRTTIPRVQGPTTT